MDKAKIKRLFVCFLLIMLTVCCVYMHEQLVRVKEKSLENASDMICALSGSVQRSKLLQQSPDNQGIIISNLAYPLANFGRAISNIYTSKHGPTNLDYYLRGLEIGLSDSVKNNDEELLDSVLKSMQQLSSELYDTYRSARDMTERHPLPMPILRERYIRRRLDKIMEELKITEPYKIAWEAYHPQ